MSMVNNNTGLQELIDNALAHKAETAPVDFKSTFNRSDNVEFLEVIKAIVAMANSGGGTIIPPHPAASPAFSSVNLTMYNIHHEANAALSG